MQYRVTCPLCQSVMTVNGQPSPDAKIKCPQGGHVFRFKAGSPTPVNVAAGTPVAAPAPPRPAPAPAASAPSLARPVIAPGLAIGIMAAILVAGGGIMAAILLSKGDGDPVDRAVNGDGNPGGGAIMLAELREQLENERLARALAEERAAKERADRDRAEALAQETRAAKERAEKESADKEKADQESAEKERLAKAQAQKDRDEFTRLMIDGGTAFGAKKYEDAVNAYNAAVKLFPDDVNAMQKLSDAKTALAALAKTQDADQKRKEDYAKLLAQAQDAVVKKQFATAVELYKLAIALAPGEEVVVKGLTDAQAALAKNDDEKKKLAKYESHLTAGKAAMDAGKFADALREFAAARELFPFSPLAAQLARQAETQLADLKNDDQKQKEFNRLIDLANIAMTGRRFAEAEQFYAQALKLSPKDEVATHGLAQAQQARRNLEIEFDRLMSLGTLAMRDGRVRDAIRHFREATRLAPDNAVAARALRDAELLLEAARVYTLAMQRGNDAFKKGRIRDARDFFAEALKAIPTDQTARDALAEAERRLEVEGRNVKEFDRRVFDGQRLIKVQKFREARDELNKAAELMPNHVNTPLVLRQARYADAMLTGMTAMNQKRYADAVRAFEAALSEIPNDFIAQTNLIKARGLAKTK